MMKYIYGLLALSMLFSSGSLLGWIIEVLFRRYSTDNKERIWINPGFLCGPCLPLYGFGLITLFLLANLEKFIATDNAYLKKAILFLIMAAAMTAIEFIAGEIFILRKHIKLWDYSDMRFNYKGIVCVRYSVYWAALGGMYYFFIHPVILRYIDWFYDNPLFSFVIGIFYGILIVDLGYSFEITAKIKTFAEENRMIIRFEELKKHIRISAQQHKEKYLFMRALESERSIKEQLKSYMEKQLEQAKNGKLNDFIDSKLRFRK